MFRLIICLFLISLSNAFGLSMKVYLTEYRAPYSVSVEGGYTIENASYGTHITKGTEPFTVLASEKGAKIEGVGVFSGIVVRSKETLRLNGDPYSGDMLFAMHNGTVIAINIVELEDYTMGVLPYEMSPNWPLEALKAQALCARTYALFHYLNNHRVNDTKPYDIDNTTKFQVYKGKTRVNDAIEKAVRLTEGETLTFRDKVIPAFFFASSGGYTETAFNAFSADIPYLRGVPDLYSDEYPQAWTKTMTLQKFADVAGVNVGNVQRVVVSERNLAKTAKTITVIGNKGRASIKGSELRKKMGATELPSLYIDIAQDKDALTITGKGKGHGVGLSQWGAYGMAENGFGYRHIVRHYYKQVAIRDYRTMRKLEADVWNKSDTHVGHYIYP